MSKKFCPTLFLKFRFCQEPPEGQIRINAAKSRWKEFLEASMNRRCSRTISLESNFATTAVCRSLQPEDQKR